MAAIELPRQTLNSFGQKHAKNAEAGGPNATISLGLMRDRVASNNFMQSAINSRSASHSLVSPLVSLLVPSCKKGHEFVKKQSSSSIVVSGANIRRSPIQVLLVRVSSSLTSVPSSRTKSSVHPKFEPTVSTPWIGTLPLLPRKSPFPPGKKAFSIIGRPLNGTTPSRAKFRVSSVFRSSSISLGGMTFSFELLSQHAFEDCVDVA